MEKARAVFGTEFAAFSVIDHDQQWNKSVVGLDVRSLPRSASFCATTIESAGPLVVLDTQLDPRFRDNPIVVGAPFVRFYAGFPIESTSGYRIGAVCVLGSQPRTPDSFNITELRDLALAIQSELRHNPTFPPEVA